MDIKSSFEQRLLNYNGVKKNIPKLLKFFHINSTVSFNDVIYYDDTNLKIKKNTTINYHNDIYNNISKAIENKDITKLINTYHITDIIDNGYVKLLCVILREILKIKQSIRKFNVSSSLSYIISRIPKYDLFFSFNNNTNTIIGDVMITLLQKLEKLTKKTIIDKINMPQIPKPVFKKYVCPEFIQSKTLSQTVTNGCKILIDREQYYVNYIELLKIYYTAIVNQFKCIKKELN